MARKMKARRKPKIDLTTQSPRHLRKKNKIAKIFYAVLILAFIGTTGFFVFFSPFLCIQEIELAGSADYQDEIQGKAEELIRGNIAGIIPKRHLLFINKSEIENSLLDSFKHLKNARARIVSPKKLEIELAEREGMLIMCNSGGCALIDEEGIGGKTGSQADFIQYGKNVAVVIDESNALIEKGEIINSDRFVSFVTSLKSILKEKNGIEASGFYVPHPSATEIKVKTVNGWLLYLNPNMPIDDEAESLRIILDNEIKKENQVCIEYIDLRIPDKVFYKLVDDCEDLKRAQ